MSLLKDASKTKSLAISPKSEQKASALTSKNMSEACLMVCLEEEPDCQEPSVSSSAPDYQLLLTAASMGKIWAMYDYFHLRTFMWANDYTGMLDMLHQLWRRLFFELHSSHLHSLQSWTPVSKLSPQLLMRHIPAISRDLLTECQQLRAHFDGFTAFFASTAKIWHLGRFVYCIQHVEHS